MRDAGIENSSGEARILLAGASDRTVEKLMASLSLYASDEIESRMGTFVERRLKGEPLAYITGTWEFFGIPLFIDRNVLIPRIDTETLIVAAKELLTGVKQDARILDLCCGSGCISCAMANEFPASRITAVDISEPALTICRKNAAHLGFNSRIICLKADARSVPPMGLGSYDLVICNPPYIVTDEIQSLDGSVRDFEPVLALDGGESGLDFYKDIIKYWSVVLKENSAIIFEVGEGQADPVKGFLDHAGFRNIYTRRDSTDTERCVVGIK